MKFESISFNESFWKGKSRAEFIAHERHHSLSEKQLNEAFDLLNTESTESEDDGAMREPASERPHIRAITANVINGTSDPEPEDNLED